MSHRILVIDHHPHGLQRVVDPLRKAGYEVAVARTVADGASKFGSFEPALVFIAARLPRTHGTVLCRELKRTDAGADTPIVLVVEGTGVQIDLPPLDQFGADRLIQKPVAADELLTLCRELLDSETTGVTHDRDPAAQPTGANDDGLSIALEELDALDFDLPTEARETPTPPAVQLSAEFNEDIESHIEGILSDAKSAAPQPSTGRDHDADAAVIEQLDLEKELKLRRRTDRKSLSQSPAKPAQPVEPAATRTPGPAPVPAPPAASETTPGEAEEPPAPVAATTTAELPSERTAGKFQTAAFTRSETSQPFPAAAEVEPDGGLARWSWLAIPFTVMIVFGAVFFMARPRPAPRSAPPLAGATPGAPSSTTVDVGVSDPSSPPDETEPAAGTTDTFAALTLPVADEPGIRAEPPAVESRPAIEPPMEKPEIRESRDPAPRAGVRETVTTPPVQEPVVERPVPPASPPVVEAEPEPTIEEEPVIEQREPQPAPPLLIEEADPTPPAVQDEPPPEVVEPPVDEPVQTIARPQPVTRDAVLIHRVEPSFTKKDLKKGTGTVVLRLRISEAGSVTRVLVEQGIPGSPVEAAAVATVLRWRYEPALENDRPVESWTTATFTFAE